MLFNEIAFSERILKTNEHYHLGKSDENGLQRNERQTPIGMVHKQQTSNLEMVLCEAVKLN